MGEVEQRGEVETEAGPGPRPASPPINIHLAACQVWPGRAGLSHHLPTRCTPRHTSVPSGQKHNTALLGGSVGVEVPSRARKT